MRIFVDKSKFEDYKVDDVIALTKDDKFISYATVVDILETQMIIDIDRKIIQMINELDGEAINYSLTI